MGQLSLFGRSEIAAMRDRTAKRNYSPAADEFRREHERHRKWGLQQRHGEKLRRLRLSRSAALAAATPEGGPACPTAPAAPPAPRVPTAPRVSTPPASPSAARVPAAPRAATPPAPSCAPRVPAPPASPSAARVPAPPVSRVPAAPSAAPRVPAAPRPGLAPQPNQPPQRPAAQIPAPTRHPRPCRSPARLSPLPVDPRGGRATSGIASAAVDGITGTGGVIADSRDAAAAVRATTGSRRARPGRRRVGGGPPVATGPIEALPFDSWWGRPPSSPADSRAGPFASAAVGSGGFP